VLVGHLRRRLKVLLADYDEIVVWGAGSFGDLALQYLPRDATTVVDSFSKASNLRGVPIVRPVDLQTREGRFAIVICTVAFKDVEAWLKDNAIVQPVMRMQQLLADACSDNSTRTILAVDLFNYWKGSYFETLLWKPQFLLNVSYRLLQALDRRGGALAAPLRILLKIWHSFNCCFFSVDLPPDVEAGPGLHFPHRGGAVIHKEVRIGNFCGIYQGVTVGANARGRVAQIGDNVVLWPGSIVIGDCILGDGTEVGANSTCVGPLTSKNAVLAGSPARVIKQY
jgi:serine O-acetyltransferase